MVNYNGKQGFKDWELVPTKGSISPRVTHLLFSTTNPSAVQRIPWPGSEAASGHWLGHETWLLNSTILPWLGGDEGQPSRTHESLS